jgi:hypothetical protein
MSRVERFTFLCNDQERQAIAELANRLQRSRSDAVRFVVVEAARQLTELPATLPAKVNEPQRGDYAAN